MSLPAAEQLTLLRQARAGDAAAMRRLLDDFRPPAMAVVKRTLEAGNVGPDHAGEALAEATANFQQTSWCGGRASPRTYFVRIAVNCAITIIRRQAREVSLGLVVAQAPERPLPRVAVAVTTPESLLVEREDDAEHSRLLATLRSCVADLAPVYRDAVQLYYLDQAGSCAECAARLGIKEGAFMQRLSRARRMLAGAISQRQASALQLAA